MSILAAFIVPHPPMIVPQIGHGQEKAVSETTEAYHEVARRIAEIKPETIVVTTPHSVMYSDYLHISPGSEAVGDFREFGAAEVSFKVEYDTEFRDTLLDLIEQKDIDAGTQGERKRALDHGTMVPLYFIDQVYNDYKLVRISLSGLPYSTHYSLGKCIAEAAEQTGRRTVIVASGDLSHKLKEDGPYGYVKEGPEFDREVTEAMAKGDFLRFMTLEDNLCEAVAECGLRSFIIMSGALDGKAVKPELLSYQGTFGVGYAVACFEITGEDPERHFDAEYEKLENDNISIVRSRESEPVKLARMSLEYYIKNRRIMSRPKGLSTDLVEREAGTFVSLHLGGRLRGCIGTISATQDSIADEIIRNAVSAGTQDARFGQVRADELPQLVYSVDILSEAEPISSKAELDPQKYGVIVEHKGRRGLLLPMLDGVDTVEEQVNIALQKAGISRNEPYTMERFKVVRYE